jgi:hypothetical protein
MTIVKTPSALYSNLLQQIILPTTYENKIMYFTKHVSDAFGLAGMATSSFERAFNQMSIDKG